MSYRTLRPAEAKDLLENGDGWIYLDVRTEEEFREGHAPGAQNVPLMVRTPQGRMAPNPGFVEEAQRRFQPADKLLVACAAGIRSQHACEALASAGYTALVNMHGGFLGARNATGQVTEPGWVMCGFPVECGG